MSGLSPQQRTLNNLTARGYLCGSVERRKKFPDRHKSPCQACGHQAMIEISSDLWNVFDILAVHPELHTHILVQTTSRNNHAARRNKILASMETKLALLSGMQVLIQSWRQDPKTNRWQNYDEWIDLACYKSAPHYPNDVATLVEIRRKERKPDLPPGTTLPYQPIKDDSIPF